MNFNEFSWNHEGSENIMYYYKYLRQRRKLKFDQIEIILEIELY